MPPELKELRTKSREQVEKIVLQLYNKTEKEIEAIVRNPDSSNWERHVARMILKGIAKGDHISFMVLSDYIFGAAPKKYEIKGDVGVKIAIIDPKETAEAIKQLNDEY